MRLYYCTILNQKDPLLFFIYQSDQPFFAWKHFHSIIMILKCYSELLNLTFRYLFWLQDSLGGNSKTTVIATVSPSNRQVSSTISQNTIFSGIQVLCTNPTAKLLSHFSFCIFTYCVFTSVLVHSNAAETLSTLKFAQRAKFIRNNVCSCTSLLSLLQII